MCLKSGLTARSALVFSRVQLNEELLPRSSEEIGLDVFGYVPHDEDVVRYDLVGKPLLELPPTSVALVAVRSIVAGCILV